MAKVTCPSCYREWDCQIGIEGFAQLCPLCKQTQQAEMQHRELMRQNERMLEGQREAQARYDAMPECIFCGKKFNRSKYFEYCSKLCAIKDLGREGAEEYREEQEEELEKEEREREARLAEESRRIRREALREIKRMRKLIDNAVKVLNTNDFEDANQYTRLKNCSSMASRLSDNEKIDEFEEFEKCEEILTALKAKSEKDINDRGIGVTYFLVCYGISMILGWLSSTLAVIVFAIATLAGVITIVVTKKEREKASFVLPKLEHILDGKPLPSDISSTNECHNSDNPPEEPQADSFPQRKSHGIEDDPKSGDTEYKSSNPFAGMFSSSEEEKSEASYNDTDTAQLMSIKSSKRKRGILDEE